MKKVFLPSLMLGLSFMLACSDDDVSTSSPFPQDVVENPVTPPTLDVGFDQTEISLTEGGDAVTVNLNLAAAAPVDGVITVAVIDADSTTASASDYTTNIIGDITIAEGDESKEFSIQATDDSDIEDEEVLYLSVSSNVEILGITSTVLKVTITSNEDVLVAVERATGKVFQLNPATGEGTELFQIMREVDDEEELLRGRMVETETEPLEDIRSFVYDPNSGYGYVGLSCSDDCGYIYEVDMTSGMATLFATNRYPDNDDYDKRGPSYIISWDGAVDMLVNGPDLLISSWVESDDEDDDEVSLFSIDLADAVAGNKVSIDIDDEDDGPGGLAWGGEADSVYMGNYGYLSKVNLLTGGTRHIDLNVTSEELAKFSDSEDGYESFDISNATLMSMAESINGGVYGILYDGDYGPGSSNNYFFLVQVNLETGALTYIDLMADSKAEQFQGLTVIPAQVLSQYL